MVKPMPFPTKSATPAREMFADLINSNNQITVCQEESTIQLPWSFKGSGSGGDHKLASYMSTSLKNLAKGAVMLIAVLLLSLPLQVEVSNSISSGNAMTLRIGFFYFLPSFILQHHHYRGLNFRKPDSTLTTMARRNKSRKRRPT
eukprot:CAMPEP_0202025764 /NCGR_PEP_ID=MMETSP0905-20130828/57261_1 /ASSEMBLY_ACC=CAM_ASM_000554 /TAXON_ID=420261 /ORGANISM="Thalassiosira antarctica, Strain CCMP982" /LENGTH=144 /DNA_ID=CAMNT_0048588775 /DNA_START=25 /DNA_END=455 /DNA_ORIENTATION=-